MALARTSMVLAAAGLAATLAASGAAIAAGDWVADPKTGCKVWNAYPEPDETISWDGGCENGLATGFGTLQWFLKGKLNGRYKGERKDGRANGQGINVWVNGDRFEGEWRNDNPHGKGTYTWANGSGYQGEWRDGRKHGRAVYIWPNGDRFEGVYFNDKPMAGIYIKADGTRYLADATSGSIGPGARIHTPEERAAVRKIGARICHPGATAFGMLDATLIGFVEAAQEERIQIRIASTGWTPQTYQEVLLFQNSIIWDNPDNWDPCPQ